MSVSNCRLFAAVAVLAVFSGEVFAQGQVDPQGRPYPPYGNARDANAGNGYQSGPGAPRPNVQQQQPPQSRPDAPRGPAGPEKPPEPPFRLTQQEQADLDKTLDAWEKKNGALKTFKCDFQRYQYDPVFLPPVKGQRENPKQQTSGEIKYVAPDKGLLRETDGQYVTLNPTTKKLEMRKLDDLEHWASDGKTLYKVNYPQKQVDEIPIPAELQGQGITQGPLPFVFGAKAAELKARYWIRPTTPPNDNQKVWLEIRPKYPRDSQNFSKVEIILRASDMFPEAIQITGTNGTDRDVYMLSPKGFNLLDWSSWMNEFSPSPFGFKHVKNTETAPAAADGQSANRKPLPNGQAQRTVPDAGRWK